VQTLTADQFFSKPEFDTAVMTCWEQFMAGQDYAKAQVRGLIDQSWRRCQDADVDYRRSQASPPMLGERLHRLRDQCRDLIEASAPMMSLARDFLLETGTVMVLTDAKGVILGLEGDSSLALRSATEKVLLLPGTDWSEAACGTNAIGTTLQTGAPIQVHSTEHFCFGIKKWSCSASVIRDPFDGSILGSIDVSGLSQSYSRYNMAFVMAAATRIENHISQIEANLRSRLLDRCFWQIPNSARDHIVIFDRFGRAIKANGDLDTVMRDLGAPKAPAANGFSTMTAGARQAAEWPGRLPAWLRAEWLTPVYDRGERLGMILIAPKPGAAGLKTSDPASTSRRREATRCNGFAELICDNAIMRQAIDRARRVAASSAPILLLGETGVGKELFARSVHAASAAADGPFVALNCGGLTRELLASELFGYADGAFTGARKGGMIGKIEAADEGTLFLDEIGEMPIDLQPMLLRALEEREVCRLGETRARAVDFRLVAATNRDLRKEAERATFRRDLYYRLSVVSVTIPPLRERTDDIPRLVDHFCRAAAERYHLPARRISPDLVERLKHHEWPGNVRELRNAIESLLLTATNELITEADLPAELADKLSVVATAISSGGLTAFEVGEKAMLIRALQACGGNVAAAARELGLAKSTVYAKLKKYRLDNRPTR
jgi:transcriptional regulator of acetoin/glycerol metabolism